MSPEESLGAELSSGAEPSPEASPEAEREACAGRLRAAIRQGAEWRSLLWECIRLWQGVEYRTAGRGRMRTGAVDFSYRLKVSRRTGMPTEELLISTRREGKTITRSSVELALENGLREMAERGCVSGPKKLGGFGSSYLYAIFLRWGVLRRDQNTDS